MKIVFRVVWLAALVAAGVWLWTVLFPSPEKVVRQRLATVAQRVSFTANESALARLADAESLAGYFSTNVEINLDVPGRIQHTIVGRDEITQTAVAARSTGQQPQRQIPRRGRDHRPGQTIRHGRLHRRGARLATTRT